MTIRFSRRHVIAIVSGIGLDEITAPARAASVNTVINAKPFAQTKTWSCWAAAAVILERWKDGINYSETDIAAMAAISTRMLFHKIQGCSGLRFKTSPIVWV